MSTAKASGEAGKRIKDPDDWVTGDEEMIGAQELYLETLGAEAHEPVDHDLMKAEASKEIDRLQTKTGRGRKPRRARKASQRRG